MANKNPNLDNLKPFKPGESGNPNGYPKGVKNRATISRKVLDMVGILPDAIYESLKKISPEIEKSMSLEEIIDIVQAHKAIAGKDTQAAKYLKDNIYGAPRQELEVEGKQTISIRIE